MFQSIGKYILKRRKKRLSREVITRNLDTARTALIIYNATEAANVEVVKKFARRLKEELIQVEALGFINAKGKKSPLPESQYGYSYFNQPMLNRFGIPEPTFIKKHIANNYHLLIDLNLAEQFPLQYIASLSKADFKIGLSGDYRDEVCDLTLSLQSKNLEVLTEQIMTYLAMINRK